MPFNEDVYDEFGEAAGEMIGEARDHSDFGDAYFDSNSDTRTDVGKWMEIADVGFIRQRNPMFGV